MMSSRAVAVLSAAAALLGGSYQGDALLGVRVDGALHAVGYPGKPDADAADHLARGLQAAGR